MKEKKEGIVIIDENTIYEIDTECMGCRAYYQDKEKVWEQRNEELWRRKNIKHE